MSEGIDITCLITSVPVEGESIEIEFHTDQMHLADNIAYVLKQGCSRLRVINMMLLEDMQVLHKLTDVQYGTLMEIISIQFPYTPAYFSMNYTSPSTRILVRKMTNHKEQIALRASGRMTGQQVDNLIHQFTNLTSERMIETNKNDSDAYALLKQQSPEDQMILQLVLDTIYGRMEPQVAASRLHAYAEDKQLHLPMSEVSDNVNAI